MARLTISEVKLIKDYEERLYPYRKLKAQAAGMRNLLSRAKETLEEYKEEVEDDCFYCCITTCLRIQTEDIIAAIEQIGGQEDGV